MSQQESYQFTTGETGERLDKFLTRNCAGISRSQLQKLIEDSRVMVNGKPAKSSLKLAAGDSISLVLSPTAPSDISPEPIPLDIMYEDDDLMVINKPAGLTVHPAPGNAEHTMVNAVLAHFPSLPGNSPRPGIVHRLDKDTSGLVVVAKTAAAQANLSAQFQSRTVKKVYRVLVRGRISPEHGIIEAPIGRDSSNRKKMAIATKGRAAVTEYQVLEYLGGNSYLEILLKTGRTHQIRVHLKAIGYPVIGDSVYGLKVPYLKRQFVHAFRLGFKLPSNGEYREFAAALPADLELALQKSSTTV